MPDTGEFVQPQIDEPVSEDETTPYDEFDDEEEVTEVTLMLLRARRAMAKQRAAALLTTEEAQRTSLVAQSLVGFPLPCIDPEPEQP